MEQQMNNTSDTYKATVASALYNGEATLSVDDKGLTVSSLFSDFAAGYEDFTAIKAGDYSVEIVTEGENIICSRMGQSNEWFANNLTKSFNKAVTNALKVKGECVFETKGRMTYENTQLNGSIQVYEDSICLLPPDRQGRRFPLVFLNGMKKENYALTLQMITGESAVISMVGRDLDPLEKCIIQNVQAMRKKNGELAVSLCEELSEGEKAKAANIFPEKIAVPINRLTALPALQEAINKKIAGSDMAKTWSLLCEICDGQKASAGIWELPEEEVEKLKEKMLEKLQAKAAEAEDGGGASVELTPEQEEALRWMIWAAVPSKDGRKAVVEAAFPTEDVATYIYSMPGTWESFLPVLNRAMEAIDFDREYILCDAADTARKMLISRTKSVEILRECLDGRVIHRSLASWEKGLREYLGG